MKIRSITIASTIVLIPFVLGAILFNPRLRNRFREKDNFVSDTRYDNKGMNYKGVSIDWAFCPDWQYKPLFFSSKEYLVFVFHYGNNNEYSIDLMPSYTFVSPPNRRYSANEEISMYIEDGVENELGLVDESSMSYKIPSGAAKHYIVTFEKPEGLSRFYVDADIFRDFTLRIHYAKKADSWVNVKSEWVEKYKGRG